jgi:glycosyltransferase involved in cell wall biosynthesis
MVAARAPRRARDLAWTIVAGVARAVRGMRRGPATSSAMLALAQWELGQRRDAETTLASASRAGPAASFRAASVAMAIDRPALAADLLNDGPPSDGRGYALAAEVAFRTGEFARAKRAIATARGTGYDHDLIRLLDARIDAERTVLDPAWRPSLGRRADHLPRTAGRILHLVTNSLPDTQAGYTLRSQQVARSQQRAGLDPHLATPPGFPRVAGRRGAPADEIVDGIAYHRLARDADPDVLPDRALHRHADEASSLVERLRPAALHAASNHRNAQVALALRDRFDLPVVYEVRGFLEDTWLARLGTTAAATERYERTRSTESGAMQAADVVVTLSETMRRDIVGRGVPVERIVVVPNAVEPDVFAPRPRDAALAARLGIAPDDVVVGYISTLNPYEGVGLLIEAVARLRDLGRRVRLLIVGDGPDLVSLRALAASLGLAGRDPVAVFPGRAPFARIPSYYSLIDVFVVPRLPERVAEMVTPLKPYEAMAMARTLVVSDVAALREIVEDGVTGESFPAGDGGALAKVLDSLIGDPARRAALGTAARQWVLEHRTWDMNGRRYRDVFERLGAA